MEKTVINLPEEKFSYYDTVLQREIYMAPFKMKQEDYGVSQVRLETRMIHALKTKGYVFKYADWFDFIVYYYKAASYHEL